jgi:hypothetical protein
MTLPTRDRSVSYNHTTGGIVITADAATFELFKSAALSYYKTLHDDVTNVEIQEITDKTCKVVVQYTFRVELPNHQKYTVNLSSLTILVCIFGISFCIKTSQSLPFTNSLLVVVYKFTVYF